jgi:hypothetical protein
MKKLVNNPEKELNKANELLRRVYDIIEMSHLNDHKLNKSYCTEFKFLDHWVMIFLIIYKAKIKNLEILS